MATYSRITLSGSTDNQPIAITDTVTLGEVIHSCHATALDEIYLWACNVHASAPGDLTVEMGQAASKFTYFAVPANSGLFVIVPGIHMTNSQDVTIFADASGKFVVTGYVNRITA